MNKKVINVPLSTRAHQFEKGVAGSMKLLLS